VAVRVVDRHYREQLGELLADIHAGILAGRRWDHIAAQLDRAAEVAATSLKVVGLRTGPPLEQAIADEATRCPR
jgi:hypothetical protein